MSGLLVAALAWPAVLPLVAFGIGRALRAADRRDDALRTGAPATGMPAPAAARSSAEGRPVPVGALGALG